MNRIALLVAFLSAAALVPGCATKVNVVGKFAPNSGIPVDDMPRRIAVADFSGQNGQAASVETSAVLAGAQFEGKPFFKILERKSTAVLMGEFVRKARGELDPSTVSSLGRQIGADAILLGDVSSNMNLEKSIITRTECTAENEKGKCLRKTTYNVTCFDRSASFSLTPRLVRVESAQIVYSDPKGGTAHTSYCSGESQSVSDEQLVARARSDAIRQILHDLAPYEMVMKVKLKEDTKGLKGSAKEAFESGLTFANSGRMDRACELWRKLQTDGHRTVPLLYDIAVCSESEGRSQVALKSYQDVDRMLTAPDRDVNEALERVKKQVGEKKKIGQLVGS